MTELEAMRAAGALLIDGTPASRCAPVAGEWCIGMRTLVRNADGSEVSADTPSSKKGWWPSVVVGRLALAYCPGCGADLHPKGS